MRVLNTYVSIGVSLGSRTRAWCLVGQKAAEKAGRQKEAEAEKAARQKEAEAEKAARRQKAAEKAARQKAAEAEKVAEKAAKKAAWLKEKKEPAHLMMGLAEAVVQEGGSHAMLEGWNAKITGKRQMVFWNTEGKRFKGRQTVLRYLGLVSDAPAKRSASAAGSDAPGVAKLPKLHKLPELPEQPKQ